MSSATEQWEERGWNELHVHAADGSIEGTIALLSSGLIDVNQCASNGCTPLMLGAAKGHVQVVRILLNREANVGMAATDDGLTALHFAVRTGHVAVIELLVTAGADPGAATSKGFTPLHLAAADGNLAVMTRLVEAGGDLEATNALGFTPLHMATQCGHSAVMTALVEAGADLEATTCDGLTPLHLAMLNENSAVITAVLVEAGADLEAASSDGFTPLHLAMLNGHSAVLTVLAEAGANLEAASSDGFTPLHLAATRGHSTVITGLMEAGANPNTGLSSGKTPLYFAAAEGHADAVRILLHAKADAVHACECENGKMYTPLDAAAGSGRSEVVRELIHQLGIEGCGGEGGGAIALLEAARYGHVDIMAMLVDAGVVDTGDALLVAAGGASEGPVKFLLEQPRQQEIIGKASYVNAADSDGRVPLMVSIQKSLSCSPKIVRLLVDAGADTTSAVRLTNTPGGMVEFKGTPLDLTNHCLREKEVDGEDATEEQLNWLEGIRRLLLRVEAVHAMSWLWHSDVPSTINNAEEKSEGTIASMSLRMTMPVLRRRARRRGVLFAALFRYSSGTGGGDTGANIRSSPSLAIGKDGVRDTAYVRW